MAPGAKWLDAIWPHVRVQLPAAPALVIELGCGPVGGFVPFLRAEGYDAVGVDPKAPEAPDYVQTEFEHAELPRDVDAVVACTSLHHVAQPAHVIERMADVLASGGVAVVVEWAWEEMGVQWGEGCDEVHKAVDYAESNKLSRDARRVPEYTWKTHKRT